MVEAVGLGAVSGHILEVAITVEEVAQLKTDNTNARMDQARLALSLRAS